MTYDLASAAKRKKARRRDVIEIRPVKVPVAKRAPLRDAGFSVVRAWREMVKDELLPLLERGGLVTDDGAGLTTDSSARLRVIADDGPLQQWFDQAGERIGVLIVRLAPQVRRWAVEVEDWHRKAWGAAAKAATDVDVPAFMVPMNTEAQIAAYQQWATDLIRSLADDTRKEIASLTYAAVTENRPRRELAKDLRERFGIGRRRAITIARDQTGKIAGKLDQLRSEEAGIEEFKWVHSRSSNPRDYHIERDGNIYRWNDPPGGEIPGGPINCKCTSRAVLRIGGELIE